MILDSLKILWEEHISFCKEDITLFSTSNSGSVSKNVPLPSFLWFCSSAVRVLQAYPMGVSKHVLLTELEAKW